MTDDTALEPHLVEMTTLACRLGEPVLAFYNDESLKIPKSLRPLAALNAVASLAGMILAGTNCDPTAMKFFADAVVMQAVAQMNRADDDAARDEDGSNTRH